MTVSPRDIMKVGKPILVCRGREFTDHPLFSLNATARRHSDHSRRRARCRSARRSMGGQQPAEARPIGQSTGAPTGRSATSRRASRTPWSHSVLCCRPSARPVGPLDRRAGCSERLLNKLRCRDGCTCQRGARRMRRSRALCERGDAQQSAGHRKGEGEFHGILLYWSDDDQREYSAAILALPGLCIRRASRHRPAAPRHRMRMRLRPYLPVDLTVGSCVRHQAAQQADRDLAPYPFVDRLHKPRRREPIAAPIIFTTNGPKCSVTVGPRSSCASDTRAGAC